jgi:hypothetical protein
MPGSRILVTIVTIKEKKENLGRKKAEDKEKETGKKSKCENNT